MFGWGDEFSCGDFLFHKFKFMLLLRPLFVWLNWMGERERVYEWSVQWTKWGGWQKKSQRSCIWIEAFLMARNREIAHWLCDMALYNKLKKIKVDFLAKWRVGISEFQFALLELLKLNLKSKAQSNMWLNLGGQFESQAGMLAGLLT